MAVFVLSWGGRGAGLEEGVAGDGRGAVGER